MSYNDQQWHSFEDELISALQLSTHSAVEMFHDAALYNFMIDIDTDITPVTCYLQRGATGWRASFHAVHPASNIIIIIIIIIVVVVVIVIILHTRLNSISDINNITHSLWHARSAELWIAISIEPRKLTISRS